MFIIKKIIRNIIYISFFLVISLNKLYSEPYCGGKKNFNLDKKIFYPKKIDVSIAKSQKWYTNIVSLNGYLGSKTWKHKVKIPAKFKKSYRGKVKVYFDKDIECEFNAKIKIHGGRGDHVDNLNPSLDIKLLDGHINNNSNFILFVPDTRNFENEIFVTTLAKQIGLLAPNSFATKVKINDQKRVQYLFQEEINTQFLEKNDRYKEIVLLTNKSWQINKFYPSLHGARIQLSRAYVDEKKKILLNETLTGIDRLNYHIINNINYLENNEEYINKSLSYSIVSHREHNFIDYKNSYFLNNYDLFAKFDAFLLSTQSIHGLGLFERKFSFSYFENEIFPIYYDGDSTVLSNKILSEEKKHIGKKIFKHQKLGAKYLKDFFEDFNIVQFEKKLNDRNLNLSAQQIDSAIKKIRKNLDFFLTLEILELTKPNDNYFINKLASTNDLFLAFGGEDNIFTVCKSNFVDKKDCSILPNSRDESIKVISNQISQANKKKIMYLRKKTDNYLKNRLNNKKKIKKFKISEINKTDKIFFKREDTRISIDNLEKKITINTVSPNERVLIKAKNIDSWSIFYKGAFISSIVRNTRAHELDTLLTGCITFYDSILKNLNITINNSNCEDALNFIHTNGTTENIFVKNSFYDAVDADHSNLTFKNMTVIDTEQECLGLKKGSYVVEKFLGIKCGDKAISVGELGSLKILNAEIKDSTMGLVSKDSSIIIANKVNIENTQICLSAYRYKKNFEGAYLSINNFKSNQCDKNKILPEKGSTILY